MKISVVMATYNSGLTVRSALDSVVSQSHSDVEIVVIDGGSTDGTLEVLRSFSDRIAVLVSEPDNGIYSALNKGIDLATGEVIGFVHSDDALADTHVLERVANALTDGNVDATYGDLIYVKRSDDTRVLRRWRADNFAPALLARGWMPPHPTFYARRSVYARLGKFDESYRIAADYDCMLRFLTAGIRVVYIEHVQVIMRTGGASNRSIANIIRKSCEDFRAIRVNRVGSVGTLIGKNLSKLPQFFSRNVAHRTEGKKA